MDILSPMKRRSFNLLRTVIFLLDERNEDNDSLRALLEDEASYIRCEGYGSRILFGCRELENAVSPEIKPCALIVTDSAEYAKTLFDDGYYVIGMLHENNRSVQFPSVKYIFGDINQVDIDSFVKAYQRYSGEPWEILRTKRLLIRETTVADVDEFYDLYAAPSMTLYMEGLFEDPEDEKRYQQDYIKKVYSLMGFGVWTMERLEDKAVIGRAGYSVRNGFEEVELGFLVGTKYQRMGYCLEACRAILDYGRDVLQFDKVQTLVKAENLVSIHICEKLGFKKQNEVDVEENIYGKEYNEGQRVALSQTQYGKYLKMTLNF